MYKQQFLKRHKPSDTMPTSPSWAKLCDSGGQSTEKEKEENNLVAEPCKEALMEAIHPPGTYTNTKQQLSMNLLCLVYLAELHRQPP